MLCRREKQEKQKDAGHRQNGRDYDLFKKRLVD